MLKFVSKNFFSPSAKKEGLRSWILSLLTKILTVGTNKFLFAMCTFLRVCQLLIYWQAIINEGTFKKAPSKAIGLFHISNDIHSVLADNC